MRPNGFVSRPNQKLHKMLRTSAFLPRATYQSVLAISAGDFPAESYRRGPCGIAPGDYRGSLSRHQPLAGCDRFESRDASGS
jgi:hypothetical protein